MAKRKNHKNAQCDVCRYFNNQKIDDDGYWICRLAEKSVYESNLGTQRNCDKFKVAINGGFQERPLNQLDKD